MKAGQIYNLPFSEDILYDGKASGVCAERLPRPVCDSRPAVSQTRQNIGHAFPEEPSARFVEMTAWKLLLLKGLGLCSNSPAISETSQSLFPETNPVSYGMPWVRSRLRAL